MTMVQPRPAPMPAMPIVPFDDGTYEYSEVVATVTVTPGAGAQELQPIPITPGGFLRGVTLDVSSTGGTNTTGVFSPDNPWSLFGNLSLDNIDGSNILYPKNGYAEYLISRYCRPWDGDPALDPSFASGANPTFRLSYRNELRSTIAVVPNTDARAQYRLNMTINALASANPATGLYTTVGDAVAPSVTIKVYLETYAQPPRNTLGGAPIQPAPDGLGMQRFTSHQISNALGTGTNKIQFTRVGNLIRNLILVFRDVTGVRTDLTADPLRWRLDNTQFCVETRSRRDYEMWKFFNSVTAPGVAASTRPVGVYVFQRWQQPDPMRGMAWLETSEASFLELEFEGAAAAGSLEIITEDLTPQGPMPSYLENI